MGYGHRNFERPFLRVAPQQNVGVSMKKTVVLLQKWFKMGGNYGYHRKAKGTENLNFCLYQTCHRISTGLQPFSNLL